MYRYLGLRDAFGRASATAGVYRALAELFAAAATTSLRRNRVAGVFHHLNYQASVEVGYSWTRLGRDFRNRLQQLGHVSYDDIEFMVSGPSRSAQTPALTRIIQEEPAVLYEIVETATSLLGRRSERSEISLRADFERDGADSSLFERVQLLRRAGLVELTSVTLERIDSGIPIEIRDASSGELALTTNLLGIASAIEDESLVIIDEPEISLHPQWQTQYLELLDRTFGHYKGCHFIVATHSPQVVSSINATASSVVSLDPERREAEASEDYAGQSSDYLLLKAFDVADRGNLYIRQQLARAIKLATDGELGSPVLAEILDELAAATSGFAPSDPVVTVVADLHKVAGLKRDFV